MNNECISKRINCDREVRGEAQVFDLNIIFFINVDEKNYLPSKRPKIYYKVSHTSF